jgi:hypothetical protein
MKALSRSRRALAALAVAGVLVAGCGGDDSDDAADATEEEETTTTEAEETTTTAAETPTTAPAASGPQLVVTPAEGLTDGQTVQVTGSGFTPGKSLAVAQCRIDNQGPADCHTAGSTFVTVAADGTLTAEIRIKTGPIGTASAVCDAATPCSVGTADISDPTGPDLSRTEITFA